MVKKNNWFKVSINKIAKDVKKKEEEPEDDFDTILRMGAVITFFGIIWLGATAGMFPETYSNVSSAINYSGQEVGKVISLLEYRLFDIGLSKPTLFFYIFYLLLAYWIYLIVMFIYKRIKGKFIVVQQKTKAIERRKKYNGNI
jgi:hypothetical protein